MATGGTGDVLAGVIGALLAHGECGQAATAGVFVHGRAGDLAARRLGEDGLLAGDLVEALPRGHRDPRPLAGRGVIPELTTSGEEETLAVAEELAAGFRGGEVVLLSGELGAGKTVFVRGLARGLGADPTRCRARPSSCSPPIPGASRSTTPTCIASRGDGDDAELGLEELPGPEGVLAIEWAERLREPLWSRPMRVHLAHAGESRRTLRIEEERVRRSSARAALLVAALLARRVPGPPLRGRGAAGRLAPIPARPNVLLITIDTLRSDHLGLYGYPRETSPRIDALGRRGVVFDEFYTYWPKTRGSFVAMMTGRLAAKSGYQKSHPLLLDFNPTLASVLQEAGYATAATVDNPNVAATLGFSRGFDRYRETWEEESLDDRDGPHPGHHRRRRPASSETRARTGPSSCGSTTSTPTRPTRRRRPSTPPSSTRRPRPARPFPRWTASSGECTGRGRSPGSPSRLVRRPVRRRDRSPSTARSGRSSTPSRPRRWGTARSWR